MVCAFIFFAPIGKGASGVLFVITPVGVKARARGLEPLRGDFEKANEYKGF